jgi:Flp pilus assembly protein TadG
MLLFLGGLSVDLWRVLSERRALAGMADSAAIAAATALDEGTYRSLGRIELDPDLARRRALESLAGQPDPGTVTAVHATATPLEAAVQLEGRVPLTLLKLLLPGGEAAIDLRVHAVASPRQPETGGSTSTSPG